MEHTSEYFSWPQWPERLVFDKWRDVFFCFRLIWHTSVYNWVEANKEEKTLHIHEGN